MGTDSGWDPFLTTHLRGEGSEVVIVVVVVVVVAAAAAVAAAAGSLEEGEHHDLREVHNFH